MIISPAQSRAARALLDNVSQEVIAKLAGVSQPSIGKFESPHIKDRPSPKLANKLWIAYIEMGVEFLADDGVKRAKTDFRALEGYDGFKKFINDVYETVKHGGDICVSNVNERQFEKWQSVHADDYLSKMAQIDNLRFRIIVEENDQYFTAAKYAEYRSLPSEQFSGVPTYVYGTKRADILFEEDNVTILIVDNETLAEAERKEFEISWSQASAKL
ncbi:MAG: helix-turn-helix transcriptional regulator [Bacteroidia bacterium]|nr:helix-turn-helix transcriptional regulator [Bacteroidia bacterium]